MARTICWVVPGCFGSELYHVTPGGGQAPPWWQVPFGDGTGWSRPPENRRIVWIDEEGLLGFDNRAVLRVPGPGFGRIEAGPAIHAYYGGLVNRIRRDAPADWEVIPWGYDWRLSLLDAGARLVDAIKQYTDAPGGHRILGHSAGGLVARAAWLQLAAAGGSNPITRIVTLGTPHHGCYSVPYAWTERDITLREVALQTALGQVRPPVLVAVAGVVGTAQGLVDDQVRRILELMVTFPGFYDLLPDPAGTDDPDDAHRSITYSASTWRVCLGVPLQAELNRAQGVQGLMYRISRPGAIPPANVLTCVAGTGFSTPQRIVPADDRHIDARVPPLSPLGRRQRLPTWSSTTLGDERITVNSALEPASRQILLTARHSELLGHPATLENAYRWLSEVVPTPPPPLQVALPPHAAPGEAPALIGPPAPVAPPARSPLPWIIRPQGLPATQPGRSQGSSVRPPRPRREQ